MYEKAIESIRTKKPKMAICYDFDKTLSPDDMQTFTLIPSFEIDSNVFWKESNDLAIDNLMDKNLAWMYQLIIYSQFKKRSIRKEYFREVGAKVPLYKGVDTWFARMNQYAEKKGVELEHYIISSGLKEIIEGSSISGCFNRIYASSYYYSPDGIAIWPAQAVNYTNKTQFIFRIAKGIFEEYDDRVNDSMPESQLYIPYSNIVYIGDSATDIPCMRLVKSKGGYSIGVFDPQIDKREKVYQLFNDERINLFAPADYSARSDISRFMKQIIDDVASKERIKAEKMILQIPADIYRMYMDLNRKLATVSDSIPTRDKKKFYTDLEELKSLIEGKID